MKKRIRVVQFGLGAMGARMVEWILQKEDLELVGVVVKSSDKRGRDVGEVLGWKKKVGVKCGAAEDVFEKIKAEVMLHAAVSYVPEVWKQIRPAVESGMNVITIAEEMGFPFIKYPKLSKEMDRLAKKHGVSVLGSGINPGFAMDYLVVALSGILPDVEKVKVTRLVNFAPFGSAIQKNIGIGLRAEEFKKGVVKGELPVHIGLAESIFMLACALGWKVDEIKETKVPVIASKKIHIQGYKAVSRGRVAGFDQCATGYVKGKEKIILEELGRVDPHENYKNTIIIEGKPKLVETINVPTGNITTTSHAVNLIPKVVDAKPGLLSMLDISVTPALLNKT